MKYKTLIFCLFLSTSAYALRPQMREVVIDTVCNAPLHDMLVTANKFCYQFQACPDSLFDWAYIGLGEAEVAESKTKESRDVIQLRYKDRMYDPKLKTGDVAIDIYVLGVRWWKDQHLGTKYVLSRPAKSKYPLTAHMTATYSGSILEGGDVVIRMEPISENQTKVHYEFRLVFGKVLSTFISDKTWRNAIEWRFATILENLVEHAETGTVSPKQRGPMAP
jgi:hypothetical protein